MKKIKHHEYIRSVLFGVEDSLVSTTGLLVGISMGTDDKNLILLAGLVAIVIEAVSMGAGEYLSDEMVGELDKLKRNKENPLISGAFMFTSYLLAGLVPLLPFVFFDFPLSIVFSVICSLSTLFLMGYIKGKIIHVRPLQSGFKILFVGGLATLLGLCVGIFFNRG